MKMMTTPGRSAVAGQTLSPYVGAIGEGESILGHSVSQDGLPKPRQATTNDPFTTVSRRLVDRLHRSRRGWVQPPGDRHRNDWFHHDTLVARGALRHQTDNWPTGYVGHVPDDGVFRQLWPNGEVSRRLGRPPGNHTWPPIPGQRTLSFRQLGRPRSGLRRPQCMEVEPGDV